MTTAVADEELLRANYLDQWTQQAGPTRMEIEQAVPPAQEAAWSEPAELIARTNSEPYPVDALPPTIKDAVEEVRDFVQAPVALIASSALGAVAAAVQSHVDVRRATGLEGPSSLYLLMIADSGERKTTADGYFRKAIQEWEADIERAMQHDRARNQADVEAWQQKIEGIKVAIKRAATDGKATQPHEATLATLTEQMPRPLRIPQLLRSDDTAEALAFALSHDWPAAAVISSEAGVVFGGYAMRTESLMKNLAQLNTLWDGGALKVARRTSASFDVRGARVTMSLAVQGEVLREYLMRAGDLARGSGFLARFLIAWPQSTQGYRPFREPPKSWPALQRFARRLRALLDTPAAGGAEGQLKPTVLELSPLAKQRWITFQDSIEVMLRVGGELYDVRDCASKVADNCARIAAVFHVLENGPSGAISADTIERAERLAAWHLTESRRFFGEVALARELSDALRLDEWLCIYCRREGVANVSRRTVQQKGPAALRDGRRLEAAVAELVKAGRIRERVSGRSAYLEINPVLLGDNA